MVTVQAHKFQILRCMKSGPAFKARLKLLILVRFKQVSMSTYEMNHPLGDYSPDSKFTVYDTFSLYIQNEG